MTHEVLLKFFDAVVYRTRKQDLLPDNHYTVDGTSIDTWAYHASDFVNALCGKNIISHIAKAKNRTTPGLDLRTTRHAGYRVSQRIRKRVEEIFVWFKTVGGLRKTRFRGVERTQECAFIVETFYNLLRTSKLVSAGGVT